MPAASSFVIETELSYIYFKDALKFIHNYYLRTNPGTFKDIQRGKAGDAHFLNFTAFDPGNWRMSVKVRASKRIHVEMVPEGKIPKGTLDDLREDLIISVELFEDIVRRHSLYFVWIKGQKIIPEEPPSRRKKASSRVLSSSMLVLFTLLFGVNIVLFIFFGIYAVIAIIGLQFALVLLSGKIYLRMSKWRITQENPYVHILEFHLPIKNYGKIGSKLEEANVVKIKSEIYDRTLAKGKEPTCELGERMLAKNGVKCAPDRRSAKVINVYKIVKTAAEKFKIPVPKIVISNTMIPNAAATGPSPSRGVILITTGLLVQLEDDEILSVVGHELGHLRGRDPLLLFALTSGEFALRLTVFLPFFLFSPFLYLFVSLTIVYFIAKFFEARADLLSAMKIGNPGALAESLLKIGFRKLQYERLPSYRLRGWLSWDPHPPTYFRIRRLEQMKGPQKVKHPLIRSAKDVFGGFKAAL
nr:M56 family metallopeptidase [Candidatus Njordarchaeum guaymaensis]